MKLGKSERGIGAVRIAAGVALLLLLVTLPASVLAASATQNAGEFVGEKQSKWGDTNERVKERILRWQRFGFVLNNDTFDEAKNFAIAMIEYAIASLENIKERVEGTNLSMKDEIISEIDSHIAELFAGKEKIEQAPTVEELRKAIKEVRTEWRDAKVSLQKTIVIATLDRLEEILKRGEEIEYFVEEKIREFGEKGKDTTLLEGWLEKFREDRATALEKINEAKERVMGIETPVEGFQAMKEVRESVRNAFEYVRRYMEDLREIIRLINEYGDSGDVEELMGVIE